MERIAAGGLWLPVLEPARAPALELVFVIDCDPRLRPWRELMQALIAVVRSSGRLRNVTTWTIDGHALTAQLRRGGGGQPRSARHVVDPTGRTVVLVVSDFAGPLWREGDGLASFQTWARAMPTTLVSLLPERLWDRTVLGGLSQVALSAWQRAQVSAALGCEPAIEDDAVALPVITVDPTSLRAWTALVAGDPRARLTGVAALPDPSVDTRVRAMLRRDLLDGGDAAQAAQRAAQLREELAAAMHAGELEDPVERFQREASPSVIRLAAALVRAPLRLDVMRLVQRAIAPATGPLELAEILGSRLFALRPNGGVREESVWFDIEPTVRAQIAGLGTARDGVRVLEEVGRYVRDHLGGRYDFEALMLDPDSQPGDIPDELRPFAELYVEELGRMGGRYRELARRLAIATVPRKLRTDTAARLAEPPAPPPAPLETSDAEILQHAANGDLRGALRLLIRRDGTAVYNYCRAALDDKVLGEDVQQQVFLAALRDLPRFSGRTSLRAWLFAIARHRVLDVAKARRRAPREVDEGEAVRAPDPQPLAHERLDDARLREALGQCLQKLPPHILTAVLLRFQQGFTFEEMADVCREKPGTLQAQVARALPALRRCIEDRTGDQILTAHKKPVETFFEKLGRTGDKLSEQQVEAALEQLGGAGGKPPGPGPSGAQ